MQHQIRTCSSPAEPNPIILPVSSSSAVREESKISTVLLSFSITIPCIKYPEEVIIASIRRIASTYGMKNPAPVCSSTSPLLFRVILFSFAGSCIRSFNVSSILDSSKRLSLKNVSIKLLGGELNGPAFEYTVTFPVSR